MIRPRGCPTLPTPLVSRNPPPLTAATALYFSAKSSTRKPLYIRFENVDGGHLDPERIMDDHQLAGISKAGNVQYLNGILGNGIFH